jgi:nitroimidazol reductase NimA-like FMN-containing flavoprotein (pyridoxamine 5'-phosphate oxidase superfamily)
MTSDAVASVTMGIALSLEECQSLLRSRTLGRVALVSDALPRIVPVEYVFEETSVLFRTESDTKLQAAAPGDVLAFEVDAYDPDTGDVTSVHVLGRTSIFRHKADAEPADPHEYIRLHCEIVSGRRVRSTIL